MSAPDAGEVAAAVTETHISTVIFVGARAYKLKKPVDLGFIDQSTRERRLAACRREVELNRRLAPDVYLGVLDVLDADGTPRDHLVEMRRLDPATRLSALAGRGDDLGPALWSVAHQLATLHGASPPAGPWASVASPDERLRLWRECFEVTATARPVLPEGLVEESRTLAERYLRGRGALWEARQAEGRVVCGHGDLRAEDIFVEGDQAQILDCIDFDDGLLWGDGLLDAAFLAMDLLDLGRDDDARAFLGWYRELTGDGWPPSLAHHFIGYRAQVRAKVAALRLAQGHSAAGDELRRMALLSRDALRRSQVRLVLVGGLPGSGKSTLARALAERLDAVVLASDDVRDEVDPRTDDASSDPLDEGRYAPARRHAVYEALLARAEMLLGLGESVVLDASWGDPAERAAARTLAAATLSELAELHCVAPDAVREDRIAARAARGDDPSEVTLDAARQLAGRDQPWPEATEVPTDEAPELLATRCATRIVGS